MKTVSILFFGSTEDSLLVLQRLFLQTCNDLRIHIAAVVTQPPKPVGRKHIITPTPSELWAREHNIPVLSFLSAGQGSILYADESFVIHTLASYHADLLISASYGQKIPSSTIQNATYGGLNIHPSLLPRWRGADPIPWQILAGDTETGVTIVTLTDRMDEGKIITQQSIPLMGNEERESLRRMLFSMGADLLVNILPAYLRGDINGEPQEESRTTFARRITKEDGYIPWETIQQAIREGGIDAERTERAIRAYHPWPGVWSILPNRKRIKLLKSHISEKKLILDVIQQEGRNPQPAKQIAFYAKLIS